MDLDARLDRATMPPTNGCKFKIQIQIQTTRPYKTTTPLTNRWQIQIPRREMDSDVRRDRAATNGRPCCCVGGGGGLHQCHKLCLALKIANLGCRLHHTTNNNGRKKQIGWELFKKVPFLHFQCNLRLSVTAWS